HAPGKAFLLLRPKPALDRGATARTQRVIRRCAQERLPEGIGTFGCDDVAVERAAKNARLMGRVHAHASGTSADARNVDKEAHQNNPALLGWLLTDAAPQRQTTSQVGPRASAGTS